MAKLTWLGTDGSEQGDEYIPLAPCTWCGVFFPVGQAVEVADETMIRKARGNRFFRVEENTPPQFPQPFPAPIEPTGAKSPALMPETWTNTPPAPFPDFPPDYPPEDEPDRPKRRGRPPRIRDNGNGDQ